jgi:peptidoglycan/xylan/chitin deacetylase (PgdA/CDA1 family)
MVAAFHAVNPICGESATAFNIPDRQLAFCTIPGQQLQSMNLPVLFLAAAIGLLPQTAPKKPPATAPALQTKRLHFVSPVMHVHPGPPSSPHVALTLDACTGKVDDRLLQALISNNIKATVFVTARWLKRNPEALARMLARRDLFQIENHGGKHLAAIDRPMTMFNVRAAGSTAALKNEVNDGAAAISAATGRAPSWYRGATAVYTPSAITVVKSLQFKLAGYSLSGDGGAGFSKRRAATAVSSARNGDVIIAHLNQPTKPAGAGVVEGVLALKAKGYVFVRLDEKHIGH